MSKVLLIAPYWPTAGKENWGAPHLGIWRIASWLRLHNHRVIVWDVSIDDATPPHDDWDVVGISVLHDTLPDDLNVLRQLRKDHPNAVFVAGGVEASLNYQQIFEQSPELDYVTLGEGEQAMLDIVEDRKPTGVVERTHQCITYRQFRAYSFAMDFSKMGYERYWARTASMNKDATPEEIHCVRLVASTHCPRSCAFCTMRKYRSVSAGKRAAKVVMLTPDDAVALVEKVLDEVPETETIYFNDDTFCLNREHVMEFFSKAPRLRYLVQAHIEEMDREMLCHLGENGCIQISFGVENCDPQVVKDLNKNVDIDKARNVVHWCFGAGILPYYLFILFCPTITIQGLIKNYIQLKKWQEQGVGISIMSFVRPYHGTPLLERDHEIEYCWNQGIRQPHAVLPDDEDAKTIYQEFHERLPGYLKDMTHPFKGNTSVVMIHLLGDLLREHKYYEE